MTSKDERRSLRLRWPSGTVPDPTRGRIETAVLSLSRDSHVIVEDIRPGHENEYAQVLLRSDDIYQLEYRDGAPTRHFQTLTVSADSVIDALDGWRLGTDEWRDVFQWTSIGQWFE